MSWRGEGSTSVRGRGVLGVVLVGSIVPVVVVVTFLCAPRFGQSSNLANTFARDRALFAAESGLDQALFQARTGSLNHGVEQLGELDSGISSFCFVTTRGAEPGAAIEVTATGNCQRRTVRLTASIDVSSSSGVLSLVRWREVPTN